MAIKDYSTTPASNTALFPEGMNPADVNNGMRQVQADIRSWYNIPNWRDLGNTPTRTATNMFTLVGDQTLIYPVGMRIRLTDTTTFLYGTVTAVSYSAPNTTVTVLLDSGTLSTNLTNVSAGPDPTNYPISPSALGAAPAFAGSISVGVNANIAGNVLAGNVVSNGLTTSLRFNPNIGAAAADGLYRTDAGTIYLQSNNATTKFTATDILFAGVDANPATFTVAKSGTGSGNAQLVLQRNSSTGTSLFFDGSNTTLSSAAGSLILQQTTGSNAVLTLSSGAITSNQPITAPSFVTTSTPAVGSVGGFLWGHPTNSTTYNFGDSIAGSLLQPAGLATSGTTNSSTGTVSGTWRCLGATNGSSTSTLWQRTV